jgi:hypothetical protein
MKIITVITKGGRYSPSSHKINLVQKFPKYLRHILILFFQAVIFPQATSPKALHEYFPSPPMAMPRPFLLPDFVNQ